MNERIRELADKIWAEEYWDKPNTDKLLPAQLNKFAELIVQECADWIDEQDESRCPWSRDLIRHFGVKE